MIQNLDILEMSCFFNHDKYKLYCLINFFLNSIIQPILLINSVSSCICKKHTTIRLALG
jgi:hypothetical protein